jgi:hypothetical protein
LKLSPNPNNGQFTVELNAPKKEVYTIIVTNMLGVTLISETKTANAGINRWSFASSKLQKGVYMLHAQTEKASITQNFVVDK